MISHSRKPPLCEAYWARQTLKLMARCENSLYVIHSVMPVVNPFWFCVILAAEKSSGSRTLKAQQAYIYLYHGEAEHKPLHSTFLRACLMPLPMKWISAVEEHPSVMWQKITPSPSSNAKNDRKGINGIFMLRATIHKGLWIERNLSTDSKGPFCWGKYWSDFRWKQLYNMTDSALSLRALRILIFRDFKVPTISDSSICFKTSTHSKNISFIIASSKRKFLKSNNL